MASRSSTLDHHDLAPFSSEDPDRRLARELRVPVEYYFAHLTVARALEHYRASPDPASPDSRDYSRSRAERALAEARDAGARAGWLAAGMCGHQGKYDGSTDVSAAAARILGAVLLLQEAHDELESALRAQGGRP